MSDLTPNDIINQEFRTTLRGYATEQVDEFLQQISDRLFRVMEENQRLNTQADDLRARLQQYQQTEDLVKKALILAERTADEVRQHAHQEADLLRREMERKLDVERDSLEEIRQLRLRAIAELRAVLYSQLALLESQEGPRQHEYPSGREGV
ncbi:MAG TPA: DivIVA domain-containing protein [Armatimonadota bacterium]|jgi:cell division initiation protein